MAHSDILSQPDRGLGLDRPQTEALLALFSRCDDLREFGREVIQSVVNALMDSQAQEACGAPRGSRSPERVNSRSGYRERSLSTSLGDLELRGPKLREGTYFPEGILERYTRVEASMVALVREMYVAGVSTRKVGLVAEELGVSSLSSSEVSALCAGLDEEAEAFRTRPIEGEHPYVWLDATYMKCRTGGRYASVALVTAIGMSSSGHKEFLGCACFDSESEAAWSEFLGSLRDRGLRGVRLAVSDAHAGLVAAVSRVLPGCSWQRCLTHLQPRPQPRRPGARRRPGPGVRGAGRRRRRPRGVGPGGAQGARPLPRGRRRLRGREGGRARLHVLPPRALAEDQDEQRAGAREPRDQEEVPLGAVVPLRGVHDAARVRGARRRGGQVGRPPGRRARVAPAPAPEPLEGERLEAVRLAAHEVIREVLDRHGVAE